MKIESLKGAVAPVLMGQTYQFQRDSHGRFVADVMDDKALACFLARDDHYREALEIAPPVADVDDPSLRAPYLEPPAPAEPAGWPGLHAPAIGINGEVYETRLVLLEIVTNCQISLALWNQLSDVARQRLFAAATAEAGMTVHDPAINPFAPAAGVGGQPEPLPDPAESADSGDPDARGDGQGDYEPQDGDTAAKLTAAKAAVDDARNRLTGLPPDATPEDRAALQQHLDEAEKALADFTASLGVKDGAAQSEPPTTAEAAPKPARKPRAKAT